MKDEGLENLFQTLGEIRTSRGNFELVANEFLTISKPTPENLAKYRRAKPRLETIRELIHLVVNSGHTFFELLKPPLTLGMQETLSTERSRSLFISRFFSSCKNQPSNLDQFFGRLPELSRESGFAPEILYIDQETDSFRARTILDSSESSYNIIGISRLNFQYLSIFFKNLTLAVKLFKTGLKIRCKNSRSMQLRAAVNQVSKATFRNLILAREITQEIKTTEVEEIWLTLEGHAYERTIISAIIAEKLGVKINVYQHAAVTPRQKGIFDLLNDFGNRVHVFTSGKITCEYFKFHFPFLAANICIAGSSKAEKENFELCLACPENRPYLLFVPEGTVESALSMVRFAVECSMLETSTHMVVRFHPNTPHTAIITANKLLAASKIEISRKTLGEDFQRSFACVYRSSASIIQSLSHGVLPIHFASGSYFDLDCLAIADLKYPKVDSPISLSEILSKIRSSAASELFSTSDEFINYSRDYFMPLVRISL